MTDPRWNARRLPIFGFAAASIAATVVLAPAASAERYASIVVDADTGEVMHERFADEPRYPASLTKVMTLYMVFDALNSGELRLDERLPVSAAAASMPPSKLGVKKGQTITVDSAIRALVTKSANDVAVVLAERLGGSEERFAALMTVKARFLGLTNTRFYNASGLPDERQVTTARDMARLADAIFEDHPEYYAYFATERFTWAGRTYKSHNDLIGDVTGVDGIKTGYTRASGYNLMTSAQRGDDRIIVIMMGGNTAKARDRHVTELLEAAFTTLSDPGYRPSGLPDAQLTAFTAIDYTSPVINIEDFAMVAEGDEGEGSN